MYLYVSLYIFVYLIVTPRNQMVKVNQVNQVDDKKDPFMDPIHDNNSFNNDNNKVNNKNNENNNSNNNSMDFEFCNVSVNTPLFEDSYNSYNSFNSFNSFSPYLSDNDDCFSYQLYRGQNSVYNYIKIHVSLIKSFERKLKCKIKNGAFELS